MGQWPLEGILTSTDLYTLSSILPAVPYPSICHPPTTPTVHRPPPGRYIGIHSHNVLTNRSGLILQKKIRKFAENKQTDKQTENSNTEATLIPCGSSGRAGQYK